MPCSDDDGKWTLFSSRRLCTYVKWLAKKEPFVIAWSSSSGGGEEVLDSVTQMLNESQHHWTATTVASKQTYRLPY